MTESDLWQLQSRNLRPRGMHMTRIESSTGAGILDWTYAYGANGEGVEGWVENKIITGNRFRSPVTPEQADWARQRVDRGGSCALMAMKLDGRDGIYVWPKPDWLELREQGPRARGQVVFPKPYDWGKILSVLVER